MRFLLIITFFFSPRNSGRITTQVLTISSLTLVTQVCRAASFVIRGYYSSSSSPVDPCPPRSCTLWAVVTRSLVVFNSAVNFIFFCYFGSNFRRHFLKKFCGNCYARRPVNNSTVALGLQSISGRSQTENN